MVGSRVRGHGGCRGRSSGSTEADNYAKYVLPFFQRIWSIMEKILVGVWVVGVIGWESCSWSWWLSWS